METKFNNDRRGTEKRQTEIKKWKDSNFHGFQEEKKG